MRNSLLFRIASPYIVLILVLVAGIGVYLNFFIKSNLLSALEHQLMIEANMLSDQIDSFVTENKFNEEFDSIIKRNSELTEARITIINKNGEVIQDTEVNNTQMENHLTRPEVVSAINLGFGKDIRVSNSTNREYIYVAVPIENANGEIIGISRLSVPMADFSERLLSFQLIIFLLTLIIIVIAIFISINITNRTLKPLRSLLNAINEGEKDQITFDGSKQQKDEIEKLSELIWNLTSKLKQQNQEITQEQKKLSAVLNHMTDAVIIVDEGGSVKLFNPAAKKMFQLQEDFPSERTIVEFIRNHQIYELIKDCQREQIQKEISIDINRNKMFVHVIAKPLDEIYTNAVLLIIQDFTRLNQLEKVRRDFVSNVSHELRTPIASIKALSDTLQEGALEDPPAARRFLQRMNIEIDNLTQMVQELLELSKIESGRISLKKSLIHPSDLVTIAVERMVVQAERSGLSLSINIPENISSIYVDPDRIGQVFVNLIHNAIKFTEPGGSIIVDVNENQSEVVFCIKDNGIGIEKEFQSRIFERFFKTDRARTSDGTGLGLSIVKHIIDAHNGRIWLESELRKGSAFFFSIPKN